MLLTEEQAREKWCPEARTAFQYREGGGGDHRDAMVVANRAENDAPISNCIASSCMWWRWSDEPQQVLARDDKHRRGYCGLAGNPSKP